MKIMVRVVSVALATVGLALLWFKAPGLIVAGFDVNLTAIKWLASLAPAPYGAIGEVALRGLGADRALIFAEAGFAARLVLGLAMGKFLRR